jgi:hypothetical protein
LIATYAKPLKIKELHPIIMRAENEGSNSTAEMQLVQSDLKEFAEGDRFC